MISLVIEDYCQNCSEFEADSETIWSAGFPAPYINIRCKHAQKCDSIHYMIKKSMENNCHSQEKPAL